MRRFFRPVVRFGAAVAETFRNLFLAGKSLSGIGQRVAGVTVNEATALTLPAYMAVIRVLSQTVAMLPRSLYVREERGRRKIPRHPVSMLVSNPCPAMIPMAFWEVMVGNALGCGNGRAVIVHDVATGRPVEMWPIEPWRIELRQSGGRLWYHWRADPDADGRDGVVVLDPSEVFDLHGFGATGYGGHSLIAYGAKAIGTGLARQEYAASYFENGVWGSGAIKYPHGLSDKAYDRLNRSIKENWTGPNRAFTPMMLEEGGEWETFRIPNSEAQLVEAGQFSVLEICRLAGVPPHKVYELTRMTWSNIEHMQIEWRQDGVQPWATRIEQEVKRKLIPGGFGSALYCWHNLDGLERGDMKARMEGHKNAILSGIRTPNEARSLEELDAVGEEGDVLYMQAQMAPLRVIFEGPEEPAAAAAPPPPPAPTPPADEPEEQEGAAVVTVAAGFEAAGLEWRALVDAQRPALEAAARHVVRREIHTAGAVREKHAADPEGLRRWASRWYREQRSHVATSFAPALSCIVRTAAAAGTAAAPGAIDLSPALDWWEAAGPVRAASDPDEEAWTASLTEKVQELAGSAGGKR